MKVLLFLFVFCMNCTEEEIEKLSNQIKNLEQKSNIFEQQMISLKKELSQSKTQIIIMEDNKKNNNTNNFFRKVKCVTVFLLQAILLVILVWFSWQFILKSDVVDPPKNY